MQRIGDRLVYSASDLNNFLECAFLVERSRDVAFGRMERPEREPAAELLARKGDEHEARHLERLRTRHGTRIVEIAPSKGPSPDDWHDAESATLAAMQSGAPIIYQAAFFDGTFLGRADFLRRVDSPSKLGPWSYEAVDTKLALSPKPYYLVQLCNYSEHLGRVQGSIPRAMHVVLGSGEERSFRVDDYAAYYRRIKQAFLERERSAPNVCYPFEAAHCTVCQWRISCARQRDADDHLSIVANMRRDQITKLESSSVTTLARLGTSSVEQRPYGMTESTFNKLRAQARLQHHHRTTGEHVYELLEQDERSGFSLLPQPAAGDVFFDIEGDPLYSPERGLEYLFGVYLPLEDRYRAWWARSDREERDAFRGLMDFLTERRRHYPDMHVYHYAPYETTALRRLMGYYATRERELDDLLRNDVFVDLYGIVRQALRISQPSYSIKKLEAFYGMTRSTGVKRGDDSIVMFEAWLASGDDQILEDIERYNDDDCRSTYRLRQWLLERRLEHEARLGKPLPWHTVEAHDGPDVERRDELSKRLLDDLAPPHALHDLRMLPEAQRGRWYLGHLLDYHYREAKPAYWHLYHRQKNVDRLAEFDHEAIGDLTFCADVPPERVKQSFIYTYTFPEQQHNLGTDAPYCPDRCGPAGTIVELDDEHQRLRIKLNRNLVPQNLRALVPGKPMDTAIQQRALAAIADAYLDGSVEREHPATASILLARRPRLKKPRAILQPPSVDAASVSDVVMQLDGSHLVVQGPPGSGKSTIGAAFIVDLMAAGKRVAIMANGHKAIHNVLCKVEESAQRRGITFRGVQKFTKDNESSRYVSPVGGGFVTPVHDAKDLIATPHELAAGTSWLFAREDLAGAYDVLVIDEAGQMSLADALACSACARDVVLLGDPLQLAQVSQGSHPLGTDLSVLEHLLGERETVDPACGIFLDVSYRMHPSICAFISHAVYGDRLHAAPACQNNAVDAPGTLSGSGLRYLPVEHDGNYRYSNEEAVAIVNAVTNLLSGTVTVGDRAPRPMTAADILVVSPYNAQRKRIRLRLAEAGLEDIRVGTVDKFQGQEAPVVLYSMATSSGATIPRDLEFLFERNRLNVAISRAQCLAILVCAPALLELHCNTPEQMALVNLLCAYKEATQTPLPV